jgi:lipopolysaccharide/colanic/teichoic acid biosynthesis glycosyltransferase
MGNVFPTQRLVGTTQRRSIRWALIPPAAPCRMNPMVMGPLIPAPKDEGDFARLGDTVVTNKAKSRRVGVSPSLPTKSRRVPPTVMVRPPLSRFDRFAKRVLDVVVASVGLIVFSPLLLFVAAMIKLHSRGPIFDRQTHYGYNNEKIRLLRFRSTTTDRFGDRLRGSKIDELPQLINILQGEMSLVGPRPLLSTPQGQTDQVSGLSRGLKPGLIGWAQLNGNRKEIESLKWGLTQFDVDYIQNWSFLLDLKIVAMTLFSNDSY